LRYGLTVGADVYEENGLLDRVGVVAPNPMRGPLVAGLDGEDR
jgi:hypothetical protein